MALNIRSSGLFVANINDKPVMNKKYAIDIDNTRRPNAQVVAMYNNNGNVRRAQDSLQNYIQNMNSRNRSIFDLLKQEHNDIDKTLKHGKPLKPLKPLKRGSIKLKRNYPTHISSQGLSSKIFDFTNNITDNITNTITGKITHKKKRKRRTRKNYNL
jgi:hypothetical protein